ncbi:MAG: potassium-transporting ATPase subunit KdpA [Planctomycetes bacterium]|nr:potassium-transporting ATPase subunit KdpA [Planctomycetota bacterium]
MKRSLADIGISGLLAAAAVAMGFDILLPTKLTALVVSATMLVVVMWLARDAFARLRHGRGLGQLVRLEVGLLLTCFGLAAVRGTIALRALDRPLSAAEGEAARLYDALFLGLAMLSGVGLMKSPVFARWLLRLGQRPPLLLASSFAMMILVATLLLCLPLSVESFEDIRPLDALFTATSAVCVTGLAVNEISTTYTAFGQTVILLAIQFGGIGIMTIAAVALALRSDTSLGAQAQYASLFEAGSLGELRGQVYTITTTTLAIEALGALALWLLWKDDPAFAERSVAWLAVFHSVSAFCNAGFALFPGSLARFTSDGATQLVIMALIVTGGIGFPVYHGLLRRAKLRVRAWRERTNYDAARADLGTYTVVRTTAWLIGGGALGFFALECVGAFAGLDWSERVLAALFASVTTRTAGFNTLDFASFSETTLLLTLALMFIGGSPGSTAGGVKTTTAAVLFASFRAELRGQQPTLARRAISAKSIQRASAVTAISLALVASMVALLTMLERHSFVELLFETVSAFGTVGLSLGITSELTSWGRVAIILTMFVGRIGPMGVALAVGDSRERRRYTLPENDVQIW